MFIEQIVITNFRNFAKLQLEFGPGVNIFYGSNASGKTNLLEAVFVLVLGRSQRGAGDTVMLREDSDVFRLEGNIRRNSTTTHLSTAFQQGGRKKITIDHLPEKAGALYEQFCAVSLGPEDSDILSGPPSARREFLDVYLAQFSNRYITDMIDYRRVLAQKNAALKNELDPSPFEVLQVTCGARIMSARLGFLDRLRTPSAEYYASMSHGGKFSFVYQPSVKLPEATVALPEIEACYSEQLGRYRERERAMRVSLLGPHRDEIEFSIGDRSVKTFGSRGEWRTAAIALKLAVFHLLKKKRGETPLLLLDEVFAELDERRSTSLIESLEGLGQVLLTTAGTAPSDLSGNSRVFKLADGIIVQGDQ